MPRIKPLQRSSMSEFEDVFRPMEQALGYVPNSFFTMGRDAGILRAVGGLMDAFWYPDTVSEKTRRLATFGYSWFAKSPYSAAHCACGAEEFGLSLAQMQAVDTFESSTLFSGEERAVLALCRSAANIPSTTDDAAIERLRTHFSEQQTVFIIGLIAMMAFLNKWNEMVQTELEAVPKAWVARHLPGIARLGET